MKMRLFFSLHFFRQTSYSVISATFGSYACLSGINFKGDAYESLYGQGGRDYGGR